MGGAPSATCQVKLAVSCLTRRHVRVVVPFYVACFFVVQLSLNASVNSRNASSRACFSPLQKTHLQKAALQKTKKDDQRYIQAALLALLVDGQKRSPF
jgi:hypothetical protein